MFSSKLFSRRYYSVSSFLTNNCSVPLMYYFKRNAYNVT